MALTCHSVKAVRVVYRSKGWGEAGAGHAQILATRLADDSTASSQNTSDDGGILSTERTKSCIAVNKIKLFYLYMRTKGKEIEEMKWWKTKRDMLKLPLNKSWAIHWLKTYGTDFLSSFILFTFLSFLPPHTNEQIDHRCQLSHN